ncbi:MAG TPA: hypothetical protein PLV75_05135, partial [Saprospiraceae bacterium]|nr:hypothetical protein [Saprospiraceae bacterium]
MPKGSTVKLSLFLDAEPLAPVEKKGWGMGTFSSLRQAQGPEKSNVPGVFPSTSSGTGEIKCSWRVP